MDIKANVWTDWRGHRYTTGSLVLYARMSGRSCEIAEGRVLELYEVYYDNGWQKLGPGEDVPLHDVWGWRNTETGEVSELNMRFRAESGAPWERAQLTVPREHERRARIMPTNRVSRFGGYSDKKWVWDARAQDGAYVKTGIKPVILKVTESITAVPN